MFRELVRRFSNKTTQKIMFGRWVATIDSELNNNYNKVYLLPIQQLGLIIAGIALKNRNKTKKYYI